MSHGARAGRVDIASSTCLGGVRELAAAGVIRGAPTSSQRQWDTPVWRSSPNHPAPRYTRRYSFLREISWRASLRCELSSLSPDTRFFVHVATDDITEALQFVFTKQAPDRRSPKPKQTHILDAFCVQRIIRKIASRRRIWLYSIAGTTMRRRREGQGSILRRRCHRWLMERGVARSHRDGTGCRRPDHCPLTHHRALRRDVRIGAGAGR